MVISVSTGVYSIDLIQPDSMIVQPGQSLTITCRVSGYSLTSISYATSWIRQRDGKQMDWIFTMWYDGSTSKNDSVRGRFTISRDNSKQQVYLQMNSLSTEDSQPYNIQQFSSVFLLVVIWGQ
uniref:Immunoglobulin heavy variable 6-1 n=1 Tax=Neolamprologus brichardi TaxID=32507 RepID=A0A3Q4GM25_NEOBR